MVQLPSLRTGRRGAALLAGAPFLAKTGASAQTAAPLPSWRDTPRRRALLEFITTVTTEGGPDFVPPPERIAVFDNDGTLWVEAPAYTQATFLVDRLRALAPANPAWQQDPMFRAALAGDMHAVAAGGMEGLARLGGAAARNAFGGLRDQASQAVSSVSAAFGPTTFQIAQQPGEAPVLWVETLENFPFGGRQGACSGERVVALPY